MKHSVAVMLAVLFVIGCSHAEPQVVERSPEELLIDDVTPAEAKPSDKLTLFLPEEDSEPLESEFPVLDGITETRQQIVARDADGEPVLDEDGTPMTSEEKLTEAWFAGHQRPYRVGDRIDGTDYVIRKIFMARVYKGDDEFNVRSGIDLERRPADD